MSTLGVVGTGWRGPGRRRARHRLAADGHACAADPPGHRPLLTGRAGHTLGVP